MTAIGWLLFTLMLSAKALLVLAAALGLTRLMRDRSAAERHLVWVVASACVLALPVLSLAGPSWGIGVPSSWAKVLEARSSADEARVAEPVAVEITVAPKAVRRERVSRALGTAALAPAAVTARSGSSAVPTPAAVEAVSVPVGAADETAVVVVEGAGAGAVGVFGSGAGGGPAAAAAGSGGTYRSVLPFLPFLPVAVWLIGTGVVVARLGAAFAGVLRVARGARPLLDASLLVRTHGTAAEMRLDRSIRLLEGDAAAMPITFGIVRPTLLLPSSARHWTRARQDAVLRHELEHIRRHDCLTQLIAELGCALYWFNPLMWYAAKRMRVEREHACDDAVVATGSRASDYAAELLDIARTLKSPRVTEVAAIAMAGPSHLRSRVSSLLDAGRRRDRASMKMLIPAWLGALMLITPLSSVALEVDGSTSAVDDVPTGLAALGSRFHVDPPAPPEKSAKHEDAGVRGAAPDAHNGGFTTELWPGSAARKHQSELPALAAEGNSYDPRVLQAGPDLRVLQTQWQDCLSSGRNTNVNSNSNDGRRTIKWSGSECSGEVIVEGDIQFDPSFTTITGISRGGSVRITTEEDGVERRVTITPANGGVAHDYRVNGDRREFDAAGREWLSSTLLFMFRRFGFMADERAASIVERGGVNALLAEVDVLNSDFVRSRYLAVVIERGRLDEAALDRVLRIAGTTVDSDYYLTEIVTSVAGRYDFTDGVRDAYIRAVSGLDSDHYRHVAYSTLLKNGRLTPAQVSAVLGATRDIDSDYYRAALLDELASTYGSNAGIRPAYLAAAADLDSDHYKTGVLMKLLSVGGLSSAELAEVIDAAATIDSDHYSANVLTHVVRNGLSDGTLQRAFVRASSQIDSDHYLSTVLCELATRDRLDNASLLALLEAAEGIDSDHYMAELLTELAQRHRLDGEARTRFERLMNGIDSRTRRERIAEALRAGASR